MWVIDQMTPGNPAYDLPVGFRIKGPLDATALEHGFNEIIKRHEVLRTTFAGSDGEPLQIIHPEHKIKIKITELDHLNGEERENRLQVLASEESVRSFDLTRLPLLRVSLFQLGEAERVLVINAHHIVVDGMSIGLMLDELNTFYQMFTGGSDPHPSDLAVQYADFALWQRQAIANGSYANQVEFSRGQLHGKLPVLELPCDRPRPAFQSFEGSNVFFDLPKALAQEVSSLGAHEGCTFFMTILAAFQVLLQRYSGAEDILIGTPITSRTPSDVELLIGNFLNMAALRCDLSGDPTFSKVLRRSRETTLNAFSHTDLPFEAMVENLKFERDPSRNPIFQVMLQVMPATELKLGDLEVSTYHFDLKFAQFDLSLHLYEGAGGYSGRFEYCTDLFHADTIERLSLNFMHLLEGIVRDPEQKISEIPILAESERHRILVDWNSTSRGYPKAKCLHQLLEETAGTVGGRCAVECDGRKLTYQELNAKANQLANYLVKSGVKPETFVGIHLDRSLDLLVGLLGILKTGAAYVPMDPSFPQDRLAYMMEDADVSTVVTQADLLSALPQSRERVICLDRECAKIEREDASNLDIPLLSTNLAYTIYTSGSTGKPKGVMIEHRSAVNFLASMQKEPGFNENDVLLAVTTVSFDIAVMELFLPLITGGRVVIARKDDVIDGHLLLKLIERRGVTTLQATPATWKLLIDAGWRGTPALRMLCGGEPLPRELANKMLERGGELWNMYGPTETTIWSSVQKIQPGNDPVLIGPPIANTQFYIVDRKMQPVPIGVPGELLIGGDGLSRGYLKRPELTAERFVENPFFDSRCRVYKTGDLARFRSNGTIEFLGRLDSQVKVRGFRVELGEIEQCLIQHEAVHDAVVLTWNDGNGDKRLVAYFVPAVGAEVTVSEFREFLQQKLPAYMIPSFFVEMETFPLTPNGKIDRRSFPEPEISKLEGDAGYVAPQGELEVQLAEIWRKALNVERIGANDNFFELGGHSLLAAQLFAQIERKLGLNLPLAILFQAPSIRQLSERIKQNTWKSSWNSLVPIQPQGDKPALFLIHGAEGNVLLYNRLAQKLGKDQPLYGLQSRGLDGHEPMETEIENMAAKYLEEIKLARPKGPYYLGGYCLGGTIALEIAQQLRRAGDAVALLAMIETYNLQSGPPIPFSLKAIHKAQNLYFQIRNLLLSLSEGTSRFFTEKLRVEIGRLKVKWDILYSQFFNQFHPGRRLGYQHLRINVVNDKAQAAYRPAPYDGKIILFRSKVFYRQFYDRCFGWGEVAKRGVEVVAMPNYPRGSLNDPFVDVLADRLKAEIARLSPGKRALLEERLEQRITPAADQCVLRPREPGEPKVLSFSQERLWFLEQLEGASAAFNICFASGLRGVLRVDCLKQALAEIVRRHDSLRTTLPVPAQDQPLIQQISQTIEFLLEEADLSATPEEQKGNAARQMANEVARQPMVLAEGPLFRMRLIRLAPDNHVLVVVLHHVISDAWSFDIFFRELSTLYADFHAGLKPSLPPLQIQYADFARWQREHFQGEELKRHLNYWKERLAGAPPLLELPTDFPRPAEQTYHGSCCERRIGPGLAGKIHRLGRDCDGTLFMTLLAAFSALLHRYSGQTDIAVGFPVTNRTGVELELLIGFFVNMLVLRTDFSGDPTARELIQRVRQTTLEALSHQELPFEKLVRELQPDRNLSHPPFFQVALMFQQDGYQLLQLPGLTVEPIPVNTDTAKFDLTLFASESPEGLRLGLEYATDLFTAQTAEGLLAHFECLLESFVADPNLHVSQLNLLAPAEKQQLLVEWNQTAEEYPRKKTIHALFEDQAARTPDALAVEFDRHGLTYRELDHRAEALAAELQKLDIKLETRVGLYVERSLDMVVGVLGIMKAGGAYVPLDPSFPKDRLTFMVADAQIPVLVTQKALINELPEHSGLAVCVDALQPALPALPHRPSCSAGNLAYVIYTSGSTGRPKGVQIPHRAVVNFLHSMRQTPGLRAEDVWLAITTLSFDIAGLELFLPLTTGARLVIAPRDVTADGPRLARLIKDSGATVMQATPATWRMLLESGWNGDHRLKILCGGEAIDQNLTERLLERCAELWNMYGPTETTIWSTTERLLPGQTITIGLPIANTQVYILDPNFQPVPVGVVGELLIGGDGVARGYLNRPELSSERFVPDPFDPKATGRLYRTGDLARFRGDRRIEFLGRADHQVKIRGFRIEPGEIETALAGVEGVAQAVVVAREDTLGDKRLVAYLVPKFPPPASQPGVSREEGSSVGAASTPRPGDKDGTLTALSASAVRAALRQALPEYMIPSAFVFLDVLPLTPNGKLDRKALPPPDYSPELQRTYEAPIGPTEEKLAGIMGSLLKVPRVGRKDSFFDLGGHSILAVTLFNEIDRAFGKRLPLATLFRAPTIEHLGATLEAQRDRSREWASLVPIQTEGSKPRFFCVHGAGGNVLLYRDLVRRLGGDYPFYGLQSQGLDGQEPLLTTIEAMAEKYFGEIRELQPQGPYYLGGYCLGGTIAYEIAQVLRRSGHQVALVALLDTYNFSRMEKPKLLGYLRQKALFHLDNLTRVRLSEWPAYLSSKIQVARDGELSSLLKTVGGKIRKKAPGHSRPSIEASVQNVNDRASEVYQPKPYAGRVTLFKPKVNYDFYPDAQMGWSDLVTGELEIVELPINPHAMLVEPYVGILADRLKDAIEKATQPGRKNA